MKNTIVDKAIARVKSLVDFSLPENPDRFVLDEFRPLDTRPDANDKEPYEEASLEYVKALLRFAYRLAQFYEKYIDLLREEYSRETLHVLKQEFAVLEEQWLQLSAIVYFYNNNKPQSELPINSSIEENCRILTSIYKLPVNKDIVVRAIDINSSPPAQSIIVYMDGLVASEKLNYAVLQPLMILSNIGNLYDCNTLEDAMKKIIPNKQVTRITTFEELQTGVNSGDTALLVDGFEEAILIETKGWEHRSVSAPRNEQTVRGSQAAFSENLRVNTGLIRSVLRSSDLVTEMIPIGTRGKINCALMYIDSIANPTLIKEVRRRLEGLCTDFVSDSGSLAQLIQDDTTSLFPLTLSTERPDRTVAGLLEGRVVLILEGDPFALILPINFFSFFHSAEDFSVAPTIANFMRLIRYFGAAISVGLPAMYLSISYFHQEAIPTELLLAIAGSRENVPFPAIVEVLMMEVSFELIREAGVRIPGMLGSTIGIVGAIILGQAAVTAHIVSPIVVVIISITGLASFAIPEYRMSQALRLSRFILLFFAWGMGLFGVASALIGFLMVLCGQKSFGVPYFAPVSPRTNSGMDVVIRGAPSDQEHRPDELNTLDRKRQPQISRKWTEDPAIGDEDKK